MAAKFPVSVAEVRAFLRSLQGGVLQDYIIEEGGISEVGVFVEYLPRLRSGLGEDWQIVVREAERNGFCRINIMRRST